MSQSTSDFLDSFEFDDKLFDDKPLLDMFDVKSYDSADWFVNTKKRSRTPPKVPRKMPKKVKLENTKHYFVKDVLKHKLSKKGVLYLVHWETDETTWEPYENIKNLKRLQEYFEKQKEKKEKKECEIVVID